MRILRPTKKHKSQADYLTEMINIPMNKERVIELVFQADQKTTEHIFVFEKQAIPLDFIPLLLSKRFVKSCSEFERQLLMRTMGIVANYCMGPHMLPLCEIMGKGMVNAFNKQKSKKKFSIWCLQWVSAVPQSSWWRQIEKLRDQGTDEETRQGMICGLIRKVKNQLFYLHHTVGVFGNFFNLLDDNQERVQRAKLQKILKNQKRLEKFIDTHGREPWGKEIIEGGFNTYEQVRRVLDNAITIYNLTDYFGGTGIDDELVRQNIDAAVQSAGTDVAVTGHEWMTQSMSNGMNALKRDLEFGDYRDFIESLPTKGSNKVPKILKENLLKIVNGEPPTDDPYFKKSLKRYEESLKKRYAMWLKSHA